MNSAPLLAAVLAAAGAAAPPVAPPAACSDSAPLPARFTLGFDAQASRGPFSLDGDNELAFVRDGDGYTLHSRTRSLLFSAEQRSHGRIDGDTLRPAEYVEKGPRRPPRTTRLDWEARSVRFSAAREDAPTEPSMQDRLSLLVQGALIARGRPTAPIELPVAGVRHATRYRFEPRGAETLELPAGRIDSVKFERPLSAEQDRIEVWFAPQLCWLPARLRYTDDKGNVIDNRLREARFD